MGKNNRAHRAAKAKNKTKATRHHVSDSQVRDHHAGCNHPGCNHGGGGSTRPTQDLVRDLVEFAAFTPIHGPDGPMAAPNIVAQLVQMPTALVDTELAGQLRPMVGLMWSNGWQPVELLRQIRRATSAVGMRLGTAAVLADHANRHADTLHPAWAEQISEVRATASAALNGSADPHAGWFENWSRAESFSRPEVIIHAFRVCHALLALTPLKELLPPPGQQDQAARPGRSSVSGGWDGMGALRGRIATDAAQLSFADLTNPVGV